MVRYFYESRVLPVFCLFSLLAMSCHGWGKSRQVSTLPAADPVSGWLFLSAREREARDIRVRARSCTTWECWQKMTVRWQAVAGSGLPAVCQMYSTLAVCPGLSIPECRRKDPEPWGVPPREGEQEGECALGEAVADLAWLYSRPLEAPPFVRRSTE